jgi:hypothetical protein
MEITLEKIELVKDRTGVSYKDAKDALEAANGNVVDAIIAIEESINTSAAAKVIGKSNDILEVIKDYVRQGNVSKIVVSKDEDVLLNMPVNATIIGVLIAPWAALVGTAVCFGLKYKIELILDDGSSIDITEKATDTFGDAVEKGGIVVDAVKDKGAQAYANVSGKVHDVVGRTKQTVDQLNPEDFKDTVDEMWNAAKQRVESASETASDAVKEKVSEFGDAVKGASETASDAVKEKVSEFGEAVKDASETASDAVKEKVSEFGETVKGAVENASDTASGAVKEKVGELGEAVKGAVDGVAGKR